ncbi:hypothetical protein BC828DRAFT_381080 [Blastocladiella britannica]|nr:hypothetical protein BC828DRAFT_381080 [Blastocladiella britannica]
MIYDAAILILERAASATRSPTDALAILNVLPRSSDHEVLAAVLSRGFPEFHPKLAVKQGHPHLLRYFPRRVLFAALEQTVGMTAKLGDLTALMALWELAGPGTIGRAVWKVASQDKFGNTSLLGALMTHGHPDVLDWLANTASNTNLGLAWDDSSIWEQAATHAHFHVLQWDLERGYLGQLTPGLALMSATKGDTTLLEHWIATQFDPIGAMDELQSAPDYSKFLETAAIPALDWWWIHIAKQSDLPEPSTFSDIVESALCGDMVTIEWWWTRYLHHRTPEHTFVVLATLEYAGWELTAVGTEWLWQHSHSSGTHWGATVHKHAFGFAPDWHDIDPSRFLEPMDGNVSALMLMRWWLEKWAYIDCIVWVSTIFVNNYVRNGNVEELDYHLHATHKRYVDWGSEMVEIAIAHGQLRVLEW